MTEELYHLNEWFGARSSGTIPHLEECEDVLVVIIIEGGIAISWVVTRIANILESMGGYLNKPTTKKITLPKLPIVAMLRNTCLDHDCVHDTL